MTLPAIRPLTLADLDQIMMLERLCFPHDPWTRHMYVQDLTENALATYLVAELPGAGASSVTSVRDQEPVGQTAAAGIIAWGGFWLLVDEAHISTVATHPAWRGCGLGIYMMLALLDAAQARGAVRSTLEVRADNTPAQNLYAKLGYEVAGRRKRYYRDNVDGLIMTTPLLTSQAMQARLAALRQEAITRLNVCLDTHNLHRSSSH